MLNMHQNKVMPLYSAGITIGVVEVDIINNNQNNLLSKLWSANNYMCCKKMRKLHQP